MDKQKVYEKQIDKQKKDLYYFIFKRTIRDKKITNNLLFDTFAKFDILDDNLNYIAVRNMQDQKMLIRKIKELLLDAKDATIYPKEYFNDLANVLSHYQQTRIINKAYKVYLNNKQLSQENSLQA